MKHYGPEPPWVGSPHGHYGYWRWMPPSPDDWFEEPGHWAWFPPRRRMENILADFYLGPIQRELNKPAFVELLLAEQRRDQVARL